jgi:hypothetical protein
VTDALLIVQRIFSLHDTGQLLPKDISMLGTLGVLWKLSLAVGFLCIDTWIHNITRGTQPSWMGHYGRLILYSIITASVLLLGYWGEVEFIYFQF